MSRKDCKLNNHSARDGLGHKLEHCTRAVRRCKTEINGRNVAREDVNPGCRGVEALLSEPTESTVRSLGALEGDIVILGVGGKMGPTLARMAKRASEANGVKRRVIGVSRFSSVGLERRLQSWGVETIQCDLLDRASVNALPDVANVVFMAGISLARQRRTRV